MEGLIRLNCYLIRLHNLPSIYDGGVRYKKDPEEEWKHALLVHRDGWGDCEDLGALRAAEYRVYEGIPAGAIVKRTGSRTLHAMVTLPDGTIEDPSRVLGMGRR